MTQDSFLKTMPSLRKQNQSGVWTRRDDTKNDLNQK